MPKLLGKWGNHPPTKVRSPSSALLSIFCEDCPTKIDCRKKGTLLLTSLLEEKEAKVPGDSTCFRHSQAHGLGVYRDKEGNVYAGLFDALRIGCIGVGGSSQLLD